MRRLLFSSASTAASGLILSTYAQCRSNATSYDFVIVGGGTAGLAVATRLSQELPNHCVLVIEAGPHGRNESKIYIPGLRGSTFGSVYDWSLATTPQVAANNRSITHNRGKVLGGSSALNLLIWNRASSREYDVWEELGNQGWNWDSMFPAMLQAENFQRKDGVAQYGVGGVGYRVSKLRVVDASVIPIMISANIQTAVYGIADRAAETIAAEYR